MRSFRRMNKVFAVLLILVMFLTNPVFLGPLYAASTEDKNLAISETERSLTLDSKKVTVDTESLQSLDYSNLTDEQRFNQFLNRMIPYYFKGGKKNGPEWLRTTDVNFSFTESYKPMFSITTVQPLSEVDDKGQLVFLQGRYAHQSDNNTANLGFGWRKLSSDKQQMVGLNLFYDYGFKYDLSRVGMGAEYFYKLAEYRANFYFPTSGDRITNVSEQTDGILYSYIRAVRGLDYEIGTSFEHARWLSLYASGYFYDNKYNEDEKGYKLRSVMQFTPRVSVEAGYDKSNLNTGGFYGKIAYQLADCFGPSLSGGSKEANEKTIDLTHKLLQKVERNNTIKTETFTKLVAYQGSMSVTVKNSSGVAIQGAVVQAYQNGNATGASAVTNASGVATISGLSVGTYTAVATYFSYSGTSSAVAIQKDQTASTAVSLPIVGGTALVNVFNSSSQAVSGASVTAQLVSGQIAQAEKSLIDHVLGIQTAYAAESTFTLTLVTGADGTVEFTNLPPGTYKFTATYNGQEIESTPRIVQSGGTTVVTNVVLDSTGSSDSGSAAITVTDNSDNLLSSVTVSVPVNGSIKTATTNAKGVALFSDLPIGNYVFTATKSNYINNTVNVTIHDAVTTSSTVKLTPAVQTYNIVASAGTGGNISPSGTTAVNENGSQIYTITASTGYTIANITVDGTTNVPVTGSPQTYTFSNVNSAHTIAATFTAVTTYNIVASAGTGGSINPNGTTAVNENGSQAYTITANTGYTIASIIVDGTTSVPVTGSPQTYTFSNVTATHSIVATFAVQTFNITSSAETGGSISPSGTNAVNYNSSPSYTITADTGYTIASITVDGTTNVPVTGSSQTYTFSNVNSAHTIAATFTAVPTYNIVASAGTGGSITPSGTTVVNHNGSQTYTITANTGYTISDVKVDNVSQGAITTYTFSNVTGAHTIAATFTAIPTYNIVASAGTGGSITPSGTTAVNENGSQIYTITASAGYTISDVKVDNVSQGAITSYTFSNVTGAHTISVTFAIQTFNIAASAGTGGTITPSGTTAVNYNDSQTYTVVASAGYTISDVKVDNVSQGAITTYTFSNVTGAHTIAATFTAIPTYNIVASAGSGGSITPNGTTAVNENGSQTYTITASAGYTISDVKVDNVSQGAITSYMFSNVTSAHTIAATFTAIPTYNIVASAGTGGSISPSGITAVNENGSQAYTITASAGYTISDVKVDNVSQGAIASYTFSTVTGAHTIAATFAVQTFNIAASAGTGGSITPSGTTVVNYNGSQAYTIAASAGYTISDVKVDNVSQGAITSYTFSNVTAAHTIAATFAPSGYTVNITVSTGYGLDFSTGNYFVEALLNGTDFAGKGTIDSSGHATISGLSAGTYEFWVNDDQGTYPGGGLGSSPATLPGTSSITI